jgi:hypothetical protein
MPANVLFGWTDPRMESQIALGLHLPEAAKKRANTSSAAVF